jgi:hypothetical protein
MHVFNGVIRVIQEGRFRLDTDDGRSLHFTLDRHSGIEPQDLGRFSGRRVRVSARGAEGMSGRVAHDIGEVPA